MDLGNIYSVVKSFADGFDATVEKTSDYFHYYIYFKKYRVEIHTIKYECNKQFKAAFEFYRSDDEKNIRFKLVQVFNYDLQAKGKFYEMDKNLTHFYLKAFNSSCEVFDE